MEATQDKKEFKDYDLQKASTHQGRLYSQAWRYFGLADPMLLLLMQNTELRIECNTTGEVVIWVSRMP